MTVILEWTTSGFQQFIKEIEDLSNEYNKADELERGVAINKLIAKINGIIEDGYKQISEIKQSSLGGYFKDIVKKYIPGGKPPTPAELMDKFKVNIQTLRQMKSAIESQDMEALRLVSGSAGSRVHMGDGSSYSMLDRPDAPFMVVMFFIKDLLLSAFGMSASRGQGGRGRFREFIDDEETQVCPICEKLFCRCCPVCKHKNCICNQIAEDRIKMIADFTPEEFTQ